MNVISSWSGGKDSCFALYKAIEQGHNVKYLLNFISKEYKRCCFHGIEQKLLQVQAECLGIKLFQKEVSPDMAEYEKEFKSAVSELKKENITGMVFGDVYLSEHKDWVERVCKDLEITPIELLWNMQPENIVLEFIKNDFKAKIVSCKSDIFDESWLGREINNDFLKDIKEKNICPCGENGEFHTFVYDGPIFKKKINVTKTEKILKEGFWPHWFLDIKEFEVCDK